MIRSGFALAALYLLLPLAAPAASLHGVPTFGMNFRDFRKTLDSRIRDSTLDEQPDSSTIKACKRSRGNYTCGFNDAGFRSSLEGFKDLKIVTKDVALNLRLQVDTVRGRVSAITLVGERADPVNLFQFETVLQDIMRIFEPQLGYREEQSEELASKLGLLRGDDSDDIGRPRTLIRSYAVITCLSQVAKVSTEVSCTLVPNRGSLQAMSKG
jgi:hypothetical protein